MSCTASGDGPGSMPSTTDVCDRPREDRATALRALSNFLAARRGEQGLVEVTVRFRTDHADGLQAALVRHPDGRDVEVFLALDSRIQRAD